MDRNTRALFLFLLLTPFVVGAPSEDRHHAEELEPHNATKVTEVTVTEETVDPQEPDAKNVSKAVMGPPQIAVPPGVPFMIPRPFFPFPFPPPPPLFPNMDVVQVITVPRPQKNLQPDDDDFEEDDDSQELTLPVEIPIDSMLEARRAPTADRKKKKQNKQKKPKKGKKPKKQKKQKKQKQQQQPAYPQPIIIYQNQEEPVGVEGPQSNVPGPQGAQSSYLGYYMLYVVEVRWTGTNYTQTVVTGRPISAAITVPPSTDSGVVNNLSETIVPANLVNGPQTTPACLFQRSTTTEHFATRPEVFKPIETTDDPALEQVGEESDDSEDLDSVDEEYEDDSDPKTRKKKKKMQIVTSTLEPNQF